MQSTKAARSLKNLFAGYHEPMPISKQQSQKLLDGLKTSFRQQLDKEYGRGPSSAAKPNDADSLPVARRSAANQHLKAILLNPLFSYEKDVGTTLPNPKPLPTRDPMDVFDHAVSRGMMTLKAATGCMKAKRQQLQMYPDANSRASDSETAVRVVRWLRSSQYASDLDFLGDRPFVQAILPFLVAEGLEHVAWEWTSRTINDTSNTVSSNERRKRASFLLSELVRVKSHPQYGNLDAAIATLQEAEQSFQSSPLLPKLLTLPWRSVSWLSTVESYSRSAPSAGLFNAHLDTANRLHHSVEVEKAHLHLYHPTHSDYTPALRIFQDTKKLQKIVEGITPETFNTAKSKGMGIVPWIAVLGHDTVNYLTKSGRSQEAEGVKEMLQSELAALFTHTMSTADPHGTP
jgi:hypothetical protein